MKRLPGLLTLALVGLGAAAAGLADDGSAPAPARHGMGPMAAHIERCLSTLDLSAEQNTSIQAILSSGKATLKADAEALRANHAQMQTDIANGADKATLGQNVLNQDAAMTKMKNDSQAMHDQIATQLRPDQQASFNACAASSAGWHKGRGFHQGQ
jgi:Spy/CpxP family protein refolding chaperone